jgi:hypothetical protein
VAGTKLAFGVSGEENAMDAILEHDRPARAAAHAAGLPPLPASLAPDRVGAAFGRLVQAGVVLPLPARGHTLLRWRVLAQMAACDLTLAKLYEAHADALAILAELGGAVTPHTRAGGAAPSWGVWAAESPDARLTGRHDASGVLRLNGRKAWCSGADIVSHALVTFFTESGDSALAAVALDADGVTVTGEGWHAVGMAHTRSVDVCFDDVAVSAVGDAGAYLRRPGFWQGGGGIAACWYGGALPLAQALRAKLAARPEPHALAHLGAIDFQLNQTRALLRETAAAFDRAPVADARLAALRLRASAEACAQAVLSAFGRAMGAGPLCRDAALARRYADLPVFLRQSHAERDLAEAGRLVVEEGSASAWEL